MKQNMTWEAEKEINRERGRCDKGLRVKINEYSHKKRIKKNCKEKPAAAPKTSNINICGESIEIWRISEDQQE